MICLRRDYKSAVPPSNSSTRWHFCTNCSHWPAVAYEEVKNPEYPPIDAFCPECIEKRARKNCRWWENSVSKRTSIPRVPR